MDTQGNVTSAEKPLIKRRTIAMGVAWSVPVIVGAAAAPAVAASSPGQQTQAGAQLGSTSAEKGEATGSNRQVTFILTFADVVGSSSVVITSIDGGGPWSTLPTPEVTVDPTHASATFLLSRPDTDNSTLTVTVHYTVNGVAGSTTATIKNKAR